MMTTSRTASAIAGQLSRDVLWRHDEIARARSIYSRILEVTKRVTVGPMVTSPRSRRSQAASGPSRPWPQATDLQGRIGDDHRSHEERGGEPAARDTTRLLEDEAAEDGADDDRLPAFLRPRHLAGARQTGRQIGPKDGSVVGAA
jgi:hypothetical protein